MPSTPSNIRERIKKIGDFKVPIGETYQIVLNREIINKLNEIIDYLNKEKRQGLSQEDLTSGFNSLSIGVILKNED